MLLAEQLYVQTELQWDSIMGIGFCITPWNFVGGEILCGWKRRWDESSSSTVETDRRQYHIAYSRW